MGTERTGRRYSRSSHQAPGAVQTWTCLSRHEAGEKEAPGRPQPMAFGHYSPQQQNSPTRFGWWKCLREGLEQWKGSVGWQVEQACPKSAEAGKGSEAALGRD